MEKFRSEGTYMQYRSLVAAILLQATKDYCETASEAERRVILKDLRSDYMCSLSNDQSEVIANKLVRQGKIIAERLKRHTTGV